MILFDGVFIASKIRTKNITKTVQSRGGGAGLADSATTDPSLSCEKHAYRLQRSVPVQTLLSNCKRKLQWPENEQILAHSWNGIARNRTQTRAKNCSDALGPNMALEATHLRVSSFEKFSCRSMHGSRPPSVCLQTHLDTSTDELTNAILFLLSLQ